MPVLVWKFESPPYTAVMMCVPTVSDEVMQVTCPLLSVCELQPVIVVLPSLNVTVPVGVPLPNVGATVAVNVTD